MQDEDQPFDAPGGEPEEGEEARGFTSGDFHAVVHKQIVNAVNETLISTKLDWPTVEPFLEAARELCRSDFDVAGTVQLHGLRADGETMSEAEEAYVEVSIADQDDGEPWLSRTFWLSDLIVAESDPEHVRAAIGGLERSIARLRQWLEEHEGGHDAT